ncbi:MAG: hypothetical protein ACE5HE_09765 [Phycisphaerae bacterium]
MRLVGPLAVVTIVSVLTSVAHTAHGQSGGTRYLIESALDEPVRIALSNITLRDALKSITDQSGVRIVMPPEAMALVPFGDATVIERVEIVDIPLREGLGRLFQPLGMTFEVRDDHVEVVPKAGLRCLGRRPTWEELETLAAEEPGVDADALAGLRSRVQFRVPVRSGWAMLADAVRDVGAGSADEVLTTACTNLGWAWCVSGKRIVVTSRTGQLSRMLERPISLRMNYTALIDVLQEVGHQAGVSVRIDPGALASLPRNVRQSFILNAENKPADEVLDTIAANTGLGYLIEPDGVLFYSVANVGASSATGVGSQRASGLRADPYVGKVVVPLEDGTTVEWLVRESELDPDLRRRRRSDLDKAFEQLRRQHDGQAPSTPVHRVP